MSDLFIGVVNNQTVQMENIGTGQYVWQEGSNDLQLGVNKDFIIINGTQKLVQDIIKSLMTERGDNTIYPLYGSQISSLVGGKSDFDTIRAQIKNTVIQSLAVLQLINSDNSNLDEQIQTIDIIKVSMLTYTQAIVSIQVTTASNKTVNATTIIT
jgi:phage baseplate assembly protein W